MQDYVYVGGIMKKIIVAAVMLSIMASAYGATATEKEAKNTTATKQAKLAEKNAAKAERTTLKNGKKVMHEKRDILYDSLEERVLRAPNSGAGHEAAINGAFTDGKTRLQFLLAEEEELREIEAALGLEQSEKVYLNDSYDQVVKEYKDAKTESEVLDVEHKKLTEYLGRLQAMKAKISK